MDGYAFVVKFLLRGQDRERRGTLTDSREHLSCLEFRSSVPTHLMTGEGLFSLEFVGGNMGSLLSELFSHILNPNLIDFASLFSVTEAHKELDLIPIF